jgi:hypothetical protein
LVTFGETHGRQITEALVGIWITAFNAVPPERLEAGFKQVFETSEFFPVPATLSKVFARQQGAANSVSAENSWQRCVVSPRQGTRGACNVPMDEREQFATRAAGGDYFLDECTTEELQWAKKRFIEAWSNFNERQKDFNQLPSDIRGEITSASEKMKLQ